MVRTASLTKIIGGENCIDRNIMVRFELNKSLWTTGFPGGVRRVRSVTKSMRSCYQLQGIKNNPRSENPERGLVEE